MAIPLSFIAVVTTPIESGKVDKRAWCFQGPPWFYRRLEAYRYFW
jgi:hypothetical protein